MYSTASDKETENESTELYEGNYPFGRSISVVVCLIPLLCFLLGIILAMHPIILLDSEKLLSVGALSSEISFTFYGLLFAGYTFYSETLSNLVREDASYDDIVFNMRIGFKKWLYALGIQCILAVCCNVAVCILSSSSLISPFFYNVLINTSYLMPISLMVECVVFVARMVDPESANRTASEMRRGYAKGCDSDLGSQFTAEEFLKRFNELEQFLLYQCDMNPAYTNGRRPTMFDAIKCLYEMGAINRAEANALHEVRKYRNLLVHDNDVILEPDQMNKLDDQYRFYTEEKFADAFISYREHLSECHRNGRQ